MKNYIAFILIIACAFLPVTLSAQRKGFSAGVEGGPGIRSLYGDGASELKSTTGFAAGLTAQYNFSDMFGLRTGLSYELKGATDKDVTFTDNAGNEIGVGEVKINLKYLSVPVLFRATISMEDFSVFGNAGFFGALFLSSETEIEGVDLEDNSIDNSEIFTNFDMGSALGVGAMYTINGMFNISAEIRNYLGFADINNSKYSDTIKSQSTMLLIGFSHNFGKEEETKPH